MRALRFKFGFLFIAATLFLLGTARANAGGSYPNCQTKVDPVWELVWSDDFLGDTLDRSKWTPKVQAYNENNDLEAYTDRVENLFVNNGILYLSAHKENYMRRNYTSAMVSTKDSFAWEYGRFEFCAKIPVGQGLWPAIWMMPRDSVYGKWPASGEIDIMENLGHAPETIYTTIHYGAKQSLAIDYSLPSSDFSQDFHSYVLEWEPKALRFYLDGKLYKTITPDDIDPSPWVFNKPFYIILDLAVGGGWPGNPNADTIFPQALQVSYVHVYQK